MAKLTNKGQILMEFILFITFFMALIAITHSVFEQSQKIYIKHHHGGTP